MKPTVKPLGACTECARPATHSHECVTCHVATLGIVSIKSKYPPEKLKSFTEAFCKAKLFEILKDKEAAPQDKHIALVITRLATANDLNVNDVQHHITKRLRITCEEIKDSTPEKIASYAARMDEWLTNVLTHFKKQKNAA